MKALGQHDDGDGRAGRGGAAPASRSDASPSNRASDSCIGIRFELLSCHVDSLEVSYSGVLHEHVAKRLERLKQLAQSDDPDEEIQATIWLGDVLFVVLGKGTKFFPFLLESGSFFLRVAHREEGSPLPFVYAQIRSEYLIQTGPIAAERDLQSVVRHLGSVRASCVSRIDPAADVVTDVDMTAWGPDAWVTRLRLKSSWSNGEKFTGWKLGSHKSPISLRVYDKTHEVTRSGAKPFLYSAWERNGHIPFDDVWRVEGEIRREALRAFGLDAVRDVVGALPALWAHLTGEVVRLCVPNHADLTRGRWALHPFWEHVSAVAWPGADGPLNRVRYPTRAPSNTYLIRHQKSLLECIMARDGVSDPKRASEILLILVERHLDDLSPITGLDASESLQRGAALKARKYLMGGVTSDGTRALPSPDSAEAREYRRASKGGDA